MIFLRQLTHILRNILVTDIEALVVIVHFRTHGDKVDDAAKIGFRADGKLDRHRVALETVLHHVDNIVEVGAHDIHLIHIGHARHVVLISLTPNGLRLGLDAALRTKYSDRSVKYAQRALNLNGKVHVAGGVDNIDTMPFPETGGRSRGDGDASLLLLLHPVHGRIAVVRFTDLMVHTRVKQDALRRRGFAGVDMGHDTNVSGEL